MNMSGDLTRRIPEVRNPDLHLTSNCSKLNATIYLTIDITSSDNIYQVVEAIQEIIKNSPSDTRFILRTFTNDIKILLNQRKCHFDVDAEVKKLVALAFEEGGPVYSINYKLSFACLETFSDLPEPQLRNGPIFILIFSSNASKFQGSTDTLTEKVKKETLLGDSVYFHYIKVTTMFDQCLLVKALREQFRHDQCQVSVVDSYKSIEGLQNAFKNVQEQMQRQWTRQTSCDGHVHRQIHESIDNTPRANI